MIDSLRVLLEHLIDYAGLFPPAALTMQDAVRNYARYREGKYAWALGRFIVPKERAHEVPPEFPLSVLGVPDVAPGFSRASGEGGLKPAPTFEVKAEDLERAAPGAFVEITDTSLLPELKKRGLRAKIRTGGLTADAFPTPETIAAFLRACKAEGVAFKATAGLHHPLRCVKALTYEPDAPTGTMHGFINVFLAAAVVDRAEEILRETDARSFFFGDDGASWRGHHIDIEDLVTVRRTFALSFGSCSFEEPIADLKELEWL